MFRDTFYGQKISDYGRTYGRVDYHALVSSFDAVLCNSILGYRDSFDDWEQTNGFVDNSEAIEEKREALEALEREFEELTEEKATIETALEDAEEAETNTAELLERFESFEYEANEMIEKLKWYNYEVEGVGDIDSDSIEREIDSIDFWSLRSDIEGHLDEVTEHREALEERLSEIEEELEEINGKRDELKAEIEELEEEDTTEREVFQWYIISDSGAQILEENTNEILYYNAELDLYLWGVTHWGTSWDYVLTSIPCETYEETEARERAEAEAEAKAEAKTDEDGLEEVEELLDLWDVDEEELEEVEEIEEEADPLDSENGNTLEAWIESLSRDAEEDIATPIEAETVEADKPQNEDVQLLKTWMTITSVERAIDEETKRIRAEEGDSYANECFRMMRHNFDVGDLVAHEDGGFPWTVIDTDRLGEVLLVEQDGDHTTLVDRFDVFGISSKGEEVRTPCTVGELETLKSQRVWL